MTTEVPQVRSAPGRGGASKIRLEAVFDAFTSLLFLFGSDDTILDFRAGESAETYVPPEAFIDRRIGEVLPPAAASAILATVTRARATRKQATVEYGLPMPGGERFYEARMVPLAGGRVAALVTDITERREAETIVRQQEARLRHLAELSPVIIYSLRVEEGGALAPADVSESMTSILGYSPEEALAPRWWARHIHPADRARAVAARRRVVRDGRVVHEYRFRHLHGMYRWIHDELRLLRDESGAPREVVGAWSDITPTREAEETLRESEERFGQAFENAPIGMALVDLDERFLQVNAELCRILGYSHQQLVTMRIPDITHPDDLSVEEADTTAPGGGATSSYHMERRYVHADGHVVWGRMSVSAVTDRRGRPLYHIGQLEDISERRRAEEDLRQSKERLRTIIETEPECVTIVAADGRLLDMNTSGLAMLEADSLEEVRTRPLGDYVAPHSRSAFRRLVAAVMRGRGGSLEFEVVGLRGTHRWLETNAAPLLGPDGRIDSLLHVIRDVTERRRTATALQESEERFRALIERSTDVLTVLDAEGLVTFASPSSLDSLGYAPEELVGRSIFELIHPDDGPTVRATFDRLRRTPGSTARIAFRSRHRDDSWRTFESVVRNLIHVPGAHGLVVNSRDITEQKLLEEQFQQAQKLESIGRLAGGIAHDFNNLLTVILGNLEFVEQDLPAGRADPANLAEVRSAAERARDLTRQLLAVAQRQVVEQRTLDLNAIVEGSERLLRRILGEDIDLVAALAPKLWPIKADPAQIEQILLNLSVNARDAMPAGGRLVLETANVRVKAMEAAAEPGLRPGRHVLLTVSDAGVGMLPEVRAHIFEPFFTTKGPAEGTGLGLATVYGIVRQSLGHISVVTEPGVGTTFRVYFPRSGEKPTVRPVTPRAVASTGFETILVAEDERAVREVTVRVLARAGYRVLAASNADEALELLDSADRPIDLLVTDVVLPGRSGRQLAKMITRRRPTVRVLYVSGYATDWIRRGGADARVAFLPKPFTPSVLLERVRGILDAGRTEPAGAVEPTRTAGTIRE